jgi:hypothetical protein
VIQIDYQDSRPIYEQIIDRFEKMILSGALSPDEKMPSVRQMAAQLSFTNQLYEGKTIGITMKQCEDAVHAVFKEDKHD